MENNCRTFLTRNILLDENSDFVRVFIEAGPHPVYIYIYIWGLCFYYVNLT